MPSTREKHLYRMRRCSTFDSCLGCLACTTSCPSGVQYDQLIAAVRPQVQAQPRPYPAGEACCGQLSSTCFPIPRAAAVVRTAVSVSEAGNVKAGSKKRDCSRKFPPTWRRWSRCCAGDGRQFSRTLAHCSTGPGQTRLIGWAC